MLWVTAFYFLAVGMPIVVQGAEGEMPVQLARSALSQHMTVASMLKFFLDLALARWVAPRGTKMSARSCLIVALNRGIDLIWIFMFMYTLKMIRDSGGVNPANPPGKLLNAILGVSHASYAPPLTQGEQAIRSRRSTPADDPWLTLETWSSLLSQTDAPLINLNSTMPPLPDFEDLGDLDEEFADFEDLDGKFNHTESTETEPGEQVVSPHDTRELFNSSVISNGLEQKVELPSYTTPALINPDMEGKNVSSPPVPATIVATPQNVSTTSTLNPVHSSRESGAPNMTQGSIETTQTPLDWERIESVIMYTPLDREEGAPRQDNLPHNSPKDSSISTTRAPSTTDRSVEPPAASKVVKAFQEQKPIAYNSTTFDNLVNQGEELNSTALPERSTEVSVKQMGEVRDPPTSMTNLVLTNSTTEEPLENNSTTPKPNLVPEGSNHSLGAGSIPKLQTDLESASPNPSSTPDNRTQLEIEPTSASLESTSNSNLESIKMDVSLKAADSKKGRFVTHIQQELLAWKLVAALIFCAFVSLILTTLCLIHLQVRKVNNVEVGGHIYETPL